MPNFFSVHKNLAGKKKLPTKFANIKTFLTKNFPEKFSLKKVFAEKEFQRKYYLGWNYNLQKPKKRKFCMQENQTNQTK